MMKYLPLLLFTCFLSSVVQKLHGQKRFDCNGEILISTSDGKNTYIYKLLNIPFSPPFLGILASYSGVYDALGFNPKDNYVYSIEENTNYIVRHSLYNNFEKVGSASFVDTLKSNAGDCTADGYYVCYEYNLQKMLVFDVVDEFKLIRQIDLFWDPSSKINGKFKTRLFDFAFDPNDTKTAYSYEGNFDHRDLDPSLSRGFMLKINLNFNDPNLGMVSLLEKIDSLSVTHLGGLVFNPQSGLYGFGSSSNGLNPPQDKLFEINAYKGKAFQVLSHSPSQILSDACSCPFSLSFTNIAPNEGMLCNNDVKTFVIGFDNNSYIPLENLILRDTFPEGTIIKSISSSFKGNLEFGSGVGTNILSISELFIPAKARIEIAIEVMSVDAKDGTAYNQAFLYNLPERFPSILASDDPTSSTAGDRSNFYFTTKEIKNLNWKIVSPSDCMLPDDGKIIATSSEFLEGQTYQVSLRNKIGWKEYIVNVVIDKNKSFTIDSIFPGDYQLFRFRSLSDNCSTSLKDTTIIIEAPHELLDLRLQSNSPVCEGESLFLQSLMAYEGKVNWTGPQTFGSEEVNPVIINATTVKTGKYEAIGKYGYCIQKKNVDVDVKQQIKAQIEGDSIYCIRDTISLNVATPDNEIDHLWFGPNDLKFSGKQLIIPIADKNQMGFYQVISNNGACFDTASININVFPTPDLYDMESIKTDFCDPVVLIPIMSGDTDVSYKWTPLEGLTCFDCLNPEVKPIVKSKYILNVENKFGCTDSTSVQIFLDKERVLFTPNVFFPDASLMNRVLKIVPNCIVNQILSFNIYDRGGNKIYTTFSNYSGQLMENWDGNIFGSQAAIGVYIWTAKIQLIDGSILYLSGDVTLLR